jgi:phage protein D
MSTAYFAPAFKVQIDGVSLSADVSKNITDVSVTHELGSTDSFALTIANPYPQMRWTHTRDADMFREGNAIMIEMGYVGNMQLLMDGEITRISPSFPESGPPILRVEGHSRMHRLQGSRRIRTFQRMTDKQIAEQIAQDLRLTPQADETGTPYEYVIQYNQTDLDFLRERAQYIHFEVRVEGKTLFFRKVQAAQSKTYTLVWRNPSKSFQPGIQVLPLKNFSPTLNTLRQVNTVIVRGYDPQNKQAIVGRAGSGDEETQMGGSQVGAEVTSSAFGSQTQEIQVDDPIASQEEADQRAQAIYNQRALELVTGSGATIGLPNLRAGAVIELDGLGPRFNGQYYVTQTTHSLGQGGYTTSFMVKRNAIS